MSVCRLFFDYAFMSLFFRILCLVLLRWPIVVFFSLYIGQTSHESIMYVLCSWTGMILDANFTVANLLGCIWDSTAESLIEARVQWIIETNYYINSINRPLIKKKKIKHTRIQCCVCLFLLVSPLFLCLWLNYSVFSAARKPLDVMFLKLSVSSICCPRRPRVNTLVS